MRYRRNTHVFILGQSDACKANALDGFFLSYHTNLEETHADDLGRWRSSVEQRWFIIH